MRLGCGRIGAISLELIEATERQAAGSRTVQHCERADLQNLQVSGLEARSVAISKRDADR